MSRSNKPKDTRRVLAVVRHPVGGIRTYLLYTYPHLLEHGYRFTFVGPGDARFRELADELRVWPGSEFIEAPVTRSELNLRATVAAALREKRYALIHSHGITAAALCVLANLRYGVPHVVTSHDVIRANQFPGVRGRVKRALLARVLSQADRIVTVSHDAHANHLEYFPCLRRHPHKVVTILNGIDTSRFGDDGPPGDCPSFRDEKTGLSPSLREALRVPPDAFLLGFLGRFMEQKGFLYFMEALDRVIERGKLARPVHLVAVGSGDCLVNYRWELDRYPRAKGAITFLEHVPSAAPILRELDLLVMPSLWEAFGLLAVEAMCLGVPVLGTDCLGLREVLRGSPSRTVPRGDAAALAEAIEDAVGHDWKPAALAYAPQARQRFNVVAAALRLRDLFDELVDRTRSSIHTGNV